MTNPTHRFHHTNSSGPRSGRSCGQGRPAQTGLLLHALAIGLIGCLMTLGSLPLGSTGEVTDAILDVDPRTRLQSGTGTAYGAAYSPPANPSSEDPGLHSLDTPPAYEYGDYYEGLRSPLYDHSYDHSGNDPSEESDEHLQTPTPELPLGHPHERDGVWYDEDIPTR